VLLNGKKKKGVLQMEIMDKEEEIAANSEVKEVKIYQERCKVCMCLPKKM